MDNIVKAEGLSIQSVVDIAKSLGKEAMVELHQNVSSCPYDDYSQKKKYYAWHLGWYEGLLELIELNRAFSGDEKLSVFIQSVLKDNNIENEDKVDDISVSYMLLIMGC